MAVGLIRDLLQARPNAIALFVPAEITTYAFYPGCRKQYMVANCIFRMGGAAIMLTNKRQYSRTAKYQLQYNVRVHTGQDDDSYGCANVRRVSIPCVS
jgi:3-ketoacyl-CoA synthase